MWTKNILELWDIEHHGKTGSLVRFGGAIVLGKLPVPGHLTNLDDSRARAYCACSGCGWGWFGHFSLFFLPLSGRWPDKDWNTVSNQNNQRTNQPWLLKEILRFRDFVWKSIISNRLSKCAHWAGFLLATLFSYSFRAFLAFKKISASWYNIMVWLISWAE